MSPIKTIALAVAVAVGGIWAQINDSAAAPGVFGQLEKSAPRTADTFADISETAPRTDVFTGLEQAAPRSGTFDDLGKVAPRNDGVFGEAVNSAP